MRRLELIIDTDADPHACIHGLVEALGQFHGDDEVLVHGDLQARTGAGDEVAGLGGVIDIDVLRSGEQGEAGIDAVADPEAVCFDASSYYQYRFYSDYGVTCNKTAGLRFGRTAGDYLETFAINGQKLAAVSYVTGNASAQGYPALYDASGNVMNGGDAFQQQLPAGKKIVWTNLDGAVATNYYLKTTQSVNQVTMRQLTLYYTGTAGATPKCARTLAPVISGTTVTLKGETNRNATALAG